MSGRPIAWVVTVESPSYEDAYLRLSAEGAPDGWQVTLSETDILIGEDDVGRSVDVLVTVVPSEDAPPNRLERIAVVCTHEGREVGRVTFEVSVLP